MKFECVVFINDEKPDYLGHIIQIDKLSIDEFMKNPLVFHNFNSETNPLGSVENLKKKDNKLIAIITINDRFDITCMYPAIGYIQRENSDELITISLCSNPNIDERIKTIQEQTIGFLKKEKNE